MEKTFRRIVSGPRVVQAPHCKVLQEIVACLVISTAVTSNCGQKSAEPNTPEKRKEMVKLMKDEIFAEGPVMAGLKVNKNLLTWNFLRDGPYTSKSAAEPGAALLGSHSVRVVGWDKWTNPDTNAEVPQHEAQVILYNEKRDGALCKRITDDRFVGETTTVTLAAPYKDNAVAAYYNEDEKKVCSLNSWWMSPKSPMELQHNHYAMTGMQVHQTNIMASVKGVASFNDLDSFFTIIYLGTGRFAVLGQNKDKNAINGFLTYEHDPKL